MLSIFIKMMSFSLRMMNYVFKMVKYVSKMMEDALMAHYKGKNMSSRDAFTVFTVFMLFVIQFYAKTGKDMSSRDAFNTLDEDGNGSIDRDEMEKASQFQTHFSSIFDLVLCGFELKD